MEQPFIRKDEPLPETQDFAALRERGMAHIRALAGETWTDHNVHDPGITTLEALCYALTDLAYRTQFEIQDLLTDASGATQPPEDSGLFPADEILPSSALTLADYRRLLLKVRHVRNAWLYPLGPDDPREVPLFVDDEARSLSYDAAVKSGEPVAISGLYRALVEFEIDDEFGSLNDPWLTFRVSEQESLRGVVLEIGCKDPKFVDRAVDLDRDVRRVAKVGPIREVKGPFERLTPLFGTSVQLRLRGGGTVGLDEVFVRVADAKPDPDPDAVPIDVTAQKLRAVLASDKGPVPLLWRKHRKVRDALTNVACVLNANRNLCEDFERIDTVGARRLGVCADIDVEPGADMEMIQAQVVHAIERHLNPPVAFYSLRELLDEGLSPAEIFNGPYVDYSLQCEGQAVYTKPGFLKDEALEASKLRDAVYTSDLINVVMDVPGVIAIRNVLLRSYDEFGEPDGPGEKWCLPIDALHQPLLDIGASKLLFFKNGIPFRPRRREFERTLAQLRGIAQRDALVEPNERLDAPGGRFRDPGRFFAVQHDFPQTYGIGEAGLEKSATKSRIASSRQFKAYLTVFEQILADHLAQLAGLGTLFSLNTASGGDGPDAIELTPTRRSEPVGRNSAEPDTPATPIAGVTHDFADELYIGPDGQTVLERLPDPDEGPLSDSEREALEAARGTARRDVLAYVREQVLDEGPNATARRRNRLLDHLLARFAESLSDFALGELGSTVSPERNVDNKLHFAREYPVISRRRAAGIDYTAAPHWDTDTSISGLEQRVARLLGIRDLRRRDLHCEELIEKLFQTRKIADEFRLEIRAEDQSIIFKSKSRFASDGDAMQAARTIYPALHDVDSYDKDALDDNRVVIVAPGLTLEHEDQFVERVDAVGTIYDIVDRHADLIQSGEICNDEGFHVIEHILLRPRSSKDPLMNPCFGDAGEICEPDPYSFRVSVVLPYWLSRFRDLEQRAIVERTLREECPAHVYLKICWVPNHQMMALDAAYEAWLGTFTDGRATEASRRTHLGELIQVLESLENVYPPATLHDCEEDGNEGNIVRLDHTSLGPL